MNRRTFTDVLTDAVRDWLPGIMRQGEESGRETVQVVVWLAGLSSGLLALEATHPELLSSLPPVLRSITVVLLLVVPVTAVIQRVLYHVAEIKQRFFALGLEGHLLGATAQVEEPWELADWWDRAEIIKRLRDWFGVDYEFLNTYDVPIDKAREIYRSVFTPWREMEDDRINQLGELLAAYTGRPKGDGRRLLGLDRDPAEALETTRAQARRIRGWLRASYLLFLVSSASFVSAVALIGIGLLMR